jgi:phospholipase C
VVDTINFLMQRPEWKSTAVIIAYDDSDGWYDHQLGQIVNSSQTSVDALTAPGQCGGGAPILSGISAPSAQGRCGYGPRQPFVVISPYSRSNYVDHSLTDQSSVVRFVEDNWLWNQRIGGGSFDQVAGPIDGMFTWTLPSPCYRTLILSDETGEVTQKGCAN